MQYQRGRPGLVPSDPTEPGMGPPRQPSRLLSLCHQSPLTCAPFAVTWPLVLAQSLPKGLTLTTFSSLDSRHADCFSIPALLSQVTGQSTEALPLAQLSTQSSELRPVGEDSVVWTQCHTSFRNARGLLFQRAAWCEVGKGRGSHHGPFRTAEAKHTRAHHGSSRQTQPCCRTGTHPTRGVWDEQL